jgi:hypothetical protein
MEFGLMAELGMSRTTSLLAGTREAAKLLGTEGCRALNAPGTAFAAFAPRPPPPADGPAPCRHPKRPPAQII